MKLLCTFLLLGFGACSSPRTQSPDGGDPDLSLGSDGGDVECAAPAKLVYVIDDQHVLSSFDPTTLTFSEIGPIVCPARFGATPYSMSVDRKGSAWVSFSSGELFQLDLRTRGCVATPLPVHQAGFDAFGMAFVSDVPGGGAESLFLSGVRGGGEATLGRLDRTTWTIDYVGALAGISDLSGRSDATLWAFLPDASQVDRIDPTTGEALEILPLGSTGGSALAWAMASWGGDFWLFSERVGETTTHVYRLKGSDHTVTEVMSDAGRIIVGAGVSTCAPLVIL